jgi:hypothetical protein
VSDGEVLTDREQSVEDACAALLLEMAVLRDIEAPPADADPPVVHAALRDDLRPRLDRAEGLMKELAGHKRRARRTALRRKAEADDAYDQALAALSRNAVRREYESIRDREVQARVAASRQRREQRAAERVLDLVEEAEEAMRGMFFGLRDIRRELLTALEYLPWEKSLER